MNHLRLSGAVRAGSVAIMGPSGEVTVGVTVGCHRAKGSCHNYCPQTGEKSNGRLVGGGKQLRLLQLIPCKWCSLKGGKDAEHYC